MEINAAMFLVRASPLDFALEDEVVGQGRCSGDGAVPIEVVTPMWLWKMEMMQQW